jgi:hypothetical protein
MKYLLKQEIQYKINNWVVRIYPNQHSSILIRRANKKKAIINTHKIWKNGHYVVQYYEMLIFSFNKIMTKIKEELDEKRKKFYNKRELTQLMLILSYIFKRNKRAKDKIQRWAKIKAYSDKQQFLHIALKIAKGINSARLKYGWSEDWNIEHYPYVYLFQIGNKQVSFHSDYLDPDCPQADFEWDGIINTKFPFKIPKN